MPVTNIVLNASPLILLCNSDLSFVLPELFTEIVVNIALQSKDQANKRPS